MSQGRDVAAEKVVLVCLAGKKPSALLDHLSAEPDPLRGHRLYEGGELSILGLSKQR